MKKLIATIALLGVVAGVSACSQGPDQAIYDENKPVFSEEGTAGAGTTADVRSAEPVFEKKVAK